MKTPPRQTLLVVPSWFIWAFLTTSIVTSLPQAANQVVRWLHPYTSPTEQCRQEQRGSSIGMRVEGGILCLRASHFIHEENRTHEQ